MRFFFLLALLVLAVVLAVQNAVVITVVLFLWRVDASLAVILFLCFGLGALACALVFIPSMYRRRSTLRKLERKIAQLESENAALAARPQPSVVTTNPLK